MRFIGAAVTDVGIVKKVNQDSLTLKTAHSRWGDVCMTVICDGLGGLSQGEVASGNVVLAFDRWFKEDFLNAAENWTRERIQEAWEELVLSMNIKIQEYGKRQGVELGTTLTAALFLQDKYYVIHVGDCRLYEIDDDIRQITKDHTLIEQELDKGNISEDDARMDGRRNVLLQCIGVTKSLQIDFLVEDIKPGACYLLCSDGFRHAIEQEEMYFFCSPRKCKTQEDMQGQLKKLTERNKQRGERDNISSILLQVGKEEC